MPRLLLTPLLVLVLCTCGRAQYSSLADSILAVLEEAIAAEAFPGAQVLALHRGDTLVHITAGHHTYARSRPVRKSDVYDLASVTKTSSGLLYLMQQYDRGELNLDAPLGDLFPVWKGTVAGKRTLRSALAHRAGLRPWVPYWKGTLRGNARYPWQKNWDDARTNDYRFRCRTLRRDSSRNYPLRVADDLWMHRKFRQRNIYRSIRKAPVEEEGNYKYSGLLFYLLPDYVERNTGQPYHDYLRDQFYDPLGAETLGFRPLDRGIPPDRIVPTEVDDFFRMDTLHGVVHDEGAALMLGLSGNAGLFANAADLAKLYQMLMNGGTYAGRRYLSAETIREFTRYQYPKEGNRRGLGFDKPIPDYDPERSFTAAAASPASFGHSGYTGTFVWADPEHELLYIFLSNRVHPSRSASGIYELNVRPRIHELLYRAVGIPAPGGS